MGFGVFRVFSSAAGRRGIPFRVACPRLRGHDSTTCQNHIHRHASVAMPPAQPPPQSGCAPPDRSSWTPLATPDPSTSAARLSPTGVLGAAVVQPRTADRPSCRCGIQASGRRFDADRDAAGNPEARFMRPVPGAVAARTRWFPGRCGSTHSPGGIGRHHTMSTDRLG